MSPPFCLPCKGSLASPGSLQPHSAAVKDRRGREGTYVRLTCCMASEDRPYARFRRALDVRSVMQAETAAREMGRLGLLDALDYLVLLAREAPDRYDRAAWRWLSRLLASSRPPRRSRAPRGRVDFEVCGQPRDLLVPRARLIRKTHTPSKTQRDAHAPTRRRTGRPLRRFCSSHVSSGVHAVQVERPQSTLAQEQRCHRSRPFRKGVGAAVRLGTDEIAVAVGCLRGLRGVMRSSRGRCCGHWSSTGMRHGGSEWAARCRTAHSVRVDLVHCFEVD